MTLKNTKEKTKDPSGKAGLFFQPMVQKPVEPDAVAQHAWVVPAAEPALRVQAQRQKVPDSLKAVQLA